MESEKLQSVMIPSAAMPAKNTTHSQVYVSNKIRAASPRWVRA